MQERQGNGQSNNQQNSFASSIYKWSSWLLEQAWENRDFIVGMLTLYSMVNSIATVEAATSQGEPLQTFQEPYCYEPNYCYVREGRVFANGRVEYTYNERVNNLNTPNFFADPRFNGRPVVMREIENHGPGAIAHNPHAMFRHPGRARMQPGQYQALPHEQMEQDWNQLDQNIPFRVAGHNQQGQNNNNFGRRP